MSDGQPEPYKLGHALGVKENSSWWHIIWVTRQAWPPHDVRGDWRDLAELYSGLLESGTVIEKSDPLPSHWKCRPMRDEVLRLPTDAFRFLGEDLRDLASSDRIAGGTQIKALTVTPCSVHLLIACSESTMHQRVGRLKSRSATLLSFRKQLGIGGAGTWGKGFWWARISDDSALNAVCKFIGRHETEQDAAS